MIFKNIDAYLQSQPFWLNWYRVQVGQRILKSSLGDSSVDLDLVLASLPEVLWVLLIHMAQGIPVE